MLAQLFNNPASFAIWLFALLVAITVHEYAHAKTADYLGDPTARLAGRVTLNPLAHLDPVGTLMLLLVRLGWGKPVPIDPFNLRHPRRDTAIISVSGAVSNLITASFLSLLLRLPFLPYSLMINTIVIPVIVLNVSLAIFNLIPIHPLDGGKVLVGILPEASAKNWDRFLSRYGFILLLLVIFPWFGFSIINVVIFPIINLILSVLLPRMPLI